MSKLRVGIVGAGIGRAHLRGYQTLSKKVDIVALCDLNQDRLAEIGDEYRVPLRYTDYHDLFASGEVDAVSVCLPNNLHVPASVAALEAGLHVLCEKPLAENAASGQKIVEVAAQARGKFMVCYNRRYRPDVQWMKASLRENRLGKIYRVKAGWVRETGIPARGWFVNKKMAGGGPLIDLGVHMLDLALWLLDYPEPVTVSGDVQTNFGNRGLKCWLDESGVLPAFSVEDSASAFIRLAGGLSLQLETSWAAHGRPGMDDFFVTLMGTEGTIELYVANYATENTLTYYTEMNEVPITLRPAVAGFRHDHNYAVAEFVRCITEDKAPTATVEQGMVIMKIIDAIYQSAEAGQEVAIS